jgi:leucyl aminopeptidase (aminopeptidase T)
MNTSQQIAHRIIQGIQVQPGELLQIRDRTGRADWLYDLCLAVEVAGATPIFDIEPPSFTRWLVTNATLADVNRFGHHRITAVQRADRVVNLSSGILDITGANPELLTAWRAIAGEVIAIEEARQLPILLAAIPTAAQAHHLGLTLEQLEAHVLPALTTSVAETQQHIDQALTKVTAAQQLVIRSGANGILTMQHGNRTWLTDDGVIDEADRQRGAVVSNLPAGSIYTTVLEGETQGMLYVPHFGEATDVVLHFEQGRIVHIEATTGADALAAWLDSHSGEPRRISHIGLGLNPALTKPIGWTLVDEHVMGAIFVALGENRYMGGENASALNYDLALLDVTLEVDGQSV